MSNFFGVEVEVMKAVVDFENIGEVYMRMVVRFKNVETKSRLETHGSIA